MNIKTIHFPRQLEADGSAETIRAALAAQSVKLWPDGHLVVPLIALTAPLTNALRKANLQRRVRLGLDDILEKLAAEKKGIDDVRQKSADPGQERISRLLLFSQDGAERLYRNIENTLTGHFPRVLGCMLKTDGSEIGRIFTGKPRAVKVILIEHKDAVSDVLRSIA